MAEAVIVYGWYISHEEAQALFDYRERTLIGRPNWWPNRWGEKNIRDFNILERWKVRAFGSNSDDLAYYICYKVWRQHHYEFGIKLEEFTKSSTSDLLEFLSGFAGLKRPIKDDNMRIYPELYLASFLTMKDNMNEN